ncbi:alpha/beta fold hydrolase [Aerococcaceae bacterium WGS1372]
MKKSFTTTLVTLSALTGGLMFYDWQYRKKHFWKAQSNTELILDELSIEVKPDINWITEFTISEQMNHEAIPYINQFMHEGKVNHKNYSLHYLLMLKDKSKPTIVIVHGLNEFKEKYFELAYYLLQNDYNVLIFDQRDHGQSRQDLSSQLIDTIEFDDYIEDLKILVEYIRVQYALTASFFALGHSMGGAVLMGFIQKYPNVFECAVLTSPMLTINTSPYPQSLTYLLSRLAKRLSLSNRPIPSNASEKVFPKTEEFSNIQSDSPLTNSEARRKYSANINKKVNQMITTDVTLNWLNTSMKYLNEINQSKNLVAVSLPILLFKSSDDSIVDSMGIDKAAELLANSRLITVNDAGHELYQEINAILRPYVSLIIDFFNQYR